MKRSPLQLSRMPPSPRTPSVMSTPAPATPVGWNCQNSMSCSGRPARAAMPRPSPVLMNALVEGAVGGAVERHAEVLELVHHPRRHPAHVLDGVLVPEPVGALDRVVHVPQPVVLAHVAERGPDA